MKLPSLFDIQINGFAGVDFQKPALPAAGLVRAVEALQQRHTHRFFLTLITCGFPELESKFAHLSALLGANPVLHTAICGFHLEGPWLSSEPGFCGAHPSAAMRFPDAADFCRLQSAASGRIRLVTLAPELPGSPAFIRALRDQGVEVSIGHTDASDAEIDAAIAAGARFCTHLGNGIPAIAHRHHNVMQRLLARDELHAFFIPDGIHLPPGVLRNLVRAKPEGKAFFTTDAMAAAGAPAGRYSLGSLDLEVGPDRVVRMTGSGNDQFAGSALSPDEMPENLTRWLGIEPNDAWQKCSSEVAALFGIELPELPLAGRPGAPEDPLSYPADVPT